MRTPDSDIDALDRLTVLSATFRDLPTQEREALAANLAPIATAWDERILIHTCHRVELVGLPQDSAAEPPPGVELRRGRDAVARVFNVAAGFDSAVVAEEQVLGQVREAYQTALARRETGPILNELLRRAIRFGKRVRAEAAPGADQSLAERASRWALERLAQPAERRALVAGSGEMGRRMADAFATAGMRVTVASRAESRAAAITGALPSGRHATATLPEGMRLAAGHDVVAIAVRGSASSLEVSHLGDGQLPLVIDLSSPGAVSAEAADRLGERLLDLDRIGRLDGQGAASVLDPAAERRLRTALGDERDRFVAWMHAREGIGAVALLQAQASELADRHLDRLRRRADLDEAQLADVSTAMRALLAELLHVPTEQLRGGGADADRVRELFGFGR
ncbi:MAG: hypothetical protein ACRDGV_11845 [Candidatus Limnocylindria bacterium]